MVERSETWIRKAETVIRMSLARTTDGPGKGFLSMARRSKRSHNSGSIVPLDGGKFAVRWREWVTEKDGRQRRKLRYETLGVVTRDQAEEALLEKLLASRKQKRPVSSVAGTYAELAARWERDILPMYKFSVR